MFDTVMKHIKASVRFLITKSRPENVTHETAAKPSILNPSTLVFKVIGHPQWDPSTYLINTLSHTLTHPRAHTQGSTSPLIPELCGPSGAPVVVCCSEVNVSASGVRGPPSHLFSHHHQPPQTDLGGATPMVLQ